MRLFVSTLLALVPTVALAAPLPFDKHNPPVTLDLSSAWMILNQRGDGYEVKTWFRLFGPTSRTDRLRVDVRQGKKVLQTGRCNTSWSESKVLEADCSIGGDKALKAKGAVEVDLIYIDDQDDKEYFVQTLKMNVKNWKGIGPATTWGYVPDDLLALGLLTQYTEANRSFNHDIAFDFWTTKFPGGTKPSLRCTVDGKKIPDFEVSVDRPDLSEQNEIKHSMQTDKVEKIYPFFRISMRPKNLKWGKKADLEKNYDTSSMTFLMDNQGAWDCNLRLDGKALRNFQFVVNDQGRINPSEMWQAVWPGIGLPNGIQLVDMKIPKDNGWEIRIRQDALKKSVGWGIPWAAHAKAKELAASAPPSMGTPD